MFRFFKRLIFVVRYKRAVRQANSLAFHTGMRYYVLNFDGRLRVIPKRNIAGLIARRYFRKGVKPADIEKMALYITPIIPSSHVCH